MNTEKLSQLTPPQDPIVKATSVASASIKLPKTLYNSVVTIQAEGQDVWFNVTTGAAGGTANKTNVSADDGSGVAQPATNGTFHLPAGTSRDFDLSLMTVRGDADYVWVNHITGAATGFVRIVRASGRQS